MTKKGDLVLAQVAQVAQVLVQSWGQRRGRGALVWVWCAALRCVACSLLCVGGALQARSRGTPLNGSAGDWMPASVSGQGEKRRCWEEDGNGGERGRV